MKPMHAITLFVLTCILTSSAALGQDRGTHANWPRFRGPNGAGVSSDKGLPIRWSQTQNIAWKVDMPGPGFSSPITWNDRIYVTCYSGYGLDKRNPGDKSNLKRHLVCVDAKNGRILWDAQVKAEGDERDYRSFLAWHGYATNTPTVDDSGVYVLFGGSGTIKYSHEGRVLWRRPSAKNAVGDSGSGASLLLMGDHLIVNAGAEETKLFAVDKATGRVAWDIECWAGWPTPVLLKQDAGTQLVITANMALNSDGGKSGWTHRRLEPSTASAMVHGDMLFFSDMNKVFGMKLGAGGTPQPAWEAKPGSQTCTPLYYKGLLYWVTNDNGIVCCADPKTGELKYKQRLDPSAKVHWTSPIAADDKIYFVSRNDGVHVVQAGPTFKLLAHNQIASDRTDHMATPAIWRGKLILRSKTTLYCIGNDN